VDFAVASHAGSLQDFADGGGADHEEDQRPFHDFDP
jgi:hypothetical protein